MIIKKNNYCNNEELYNKMKEWLAEGENTQMPVYIGKTIIDICKNIGSSWRFRGYPDIQDWINDAILSCVNAARKFDPEKSNNPFAFFTQCAFYVFIGNINKEHKRLNMMNELKNEMAFYADIEGNEDSNNEGINQKVRNTNDEFVKVYKLKTYNSKKKQKQTIENFYDSISR